MKRTKQSTAKHIQKSFSLAIPELKFIFVGQALAAPRRTRIDVRDAIARCVVGQMLSRKAADSIVKRLLVAQHVRAVESMVDLHPRTMKMCGLSASKTRTLREISRLYRGNPERYKAWGAMTWPDFREDAISHWGIADWTAEMLAIFYLSKPDVFPTADGTLIRLQSLLRRRKIISDSLSSLAARVSPNRSVFSLYCWRAIDENRI